jgi:hypothetical protein
MRTSQVDPLLDEAALDAVRQWIPLSLFNGVPVPVIMTVTVNFTLDGGGACITVDGRMRVRAAANGRAR